MFFDQKQRIDSIKAKLVEQEKTREQVNSSLIDTKLRLFSELSELGRENVPIQFHSLF